MSKLTDKINIKKKKTATINKKNTQNTQTDKIYKISGKNKIFFSEINFKFFHILIYYAIIRIMKLRYYDK